MKVSIMIPTYQDIIALELILKALQRQSYKNFEVVVVEDESRLETKELLKKFDTLNIQHFWQKDEGNRKAIILNKALASIKGEYIIFIDGDTIPYSTFIESHVILAEPKTVLCGRRINLGENVSSDLREGKVDAFYLEHHYLISAPYIIKNHTRHYEQGIYFSPKSVFYKWIRRYDKNVHIVGSNFSCFKNDIFKINGFDEDIIGGSKDDVDLEWRFVQSGCILKSCKFTANLFHLDHSRSSRTEDAALAKVQMQKNQDKNKFVCTNGIKKL